MTRSDWASTSKQVLVHFDRQEQEIADSNGLETAILRPAGLHKELASTQQSASSSSTFVALHIPKSAAQGSQRKRACLILPVTQPDTLSDDSNNDDEPSITLPSSLCRHFDKRLINDGIDLRLNLLPHAPVALSFVFLAAITKEAYEYAQNSQDAMERTLDGKLLRQDDYINLNDHSFRIVMTEPVLQGLVSAASTQIFITLDQSESLENGDMDELYEDESSEGYAIDERFLAKSVLDGFGSEDEDEGLEAELKGRKGLFEAVPVQDRAFYNEAFASSLQRLSLEAVNVDEENSILLDESGLAALGAFEGDWAVVGIKGQEKARVVRLFSADLQAKTTLQAAYLSPVLLQNLHSSISFDPAKTSVQISLQVLRKSRSRPIATGSALDCPLPIPFADSLTIARVAGPFSINRSYQSLFLGALRSHFERKRRVVREGDVIAVGFDKGRVRWIRGEISGEEEETDDNAGGEVLELDLPTSTTSASINTAVVQFCVVSLTPELSEPDAEEASLDTADDATLRESARVGELGCVVDTTLTKIVQTGVTKMRVVDAASWLQVESETPRPPLHSPLCATGSVFSKLSTLLEATLLPHAADYGLHLTVLLKGARGSGKKTYVRWVAQQAGVHLIELNCFDLIADTDARTEGMLRARFEQAASCAPAILLLQNVDALARKSQALETGQEPMMASVLQDCIKGLRELSTNTSPAMPVSVFGTTSSAEKCPMGILGCFKHELSLEAPSESERYAILELCLQDATLSVDVNLNHLATQTAALVACDLVDLVSRAQLACVERIRALQGVKDAQIISAGMTLTGKDFEEALSQARLSYSETIGAPKIPNVTWDDVGGLASVKDDILDTIQLPLEHPELFTDGLKKRSGILLYGPPGTGKTLLAKAVATSCSLNFFSIKGPELLNMYIGESEANVRRVFQRARDAKPCVIFFDELDSIAPKRGNQGDSGGVMDRIVSQLLAELDGMSSSDGGGGEVFVIGATNRPDLLDPALLRPGRFDRMLYLSVSETHKDQLNILQALTRKFTLDEDVGDLSVIAEQCPFNLTGADFYALCSDAMLKSMTRKASSIDEKIRLLNERSEDERKEEKHPYPLTTQYYLNEMADPHSLEIQVSRQDFEEALKELVPSVSMQEMQHYRQVQAKFSSPPTDEKADKGKGAAINGNGSGGKQNGNVSMAQLQQLYNQATLHSSGDVSSAIEDKVNGNGASRPEAEGDSTQPQLKRKNKGKGKAKATD
jgi:peroxin-6